MAVTLQAAKGRLQLATTPTERRQARDILAADGEFALRSPGASEPMPQELADLLDRILSAVASGTVLSISTLPEELTTTMAARQIGVSRPTLMRMIRDGEIPTRQVGTHHRLKTADVLAAKRARLESQRRAFDELRELEDQLGQP
ncbi:MAG: excisionase family DNA-binding protein [Propionibacteriaceae bacterium]|jgi:excisionase family DNA binding protein|nr:excisionase family DNA-binding protein [Propionibacteriaceae bacterium]